MTSLQQKAESILHISYNTVVQVFLPSSRKFSVLDLCTKSTLLSIHLKTCKSMKEYEYSEEEKRTLTFTSGSTNLVPVMVSYNTMYLQRGNQTPIVYDQKKVRDKKRQNLRWRRARKWHKIVTSKKALTPIPWVPQAIPATTASKNQPRLTPQGEAEEDLFETYENDASYEYKSSYFIKIAN